MHLTGSCSSISCCHCIYVKCTYIIERRAAVCPFGLVPANGSYAECYAQCRVMFQPKAPFCGSFHETEYNVNTAGIVTDFVGHKAIVTCKFFHSIIKPLPFILTYVY
jgi:hypothetical protein